MSEKRLLLRAVGKNIAAEFNSSSSPMVVAAVAIIVLMVCDLFLMIILLPCAVRIDLNFWFALHKKMFQVDKTGISSCKCRINLLSNFKSRSPVMPR